MFDFDVPRRPRRPSLTPMIDVVFLLLVFFMLASRFGLDLQLPLNLAGGVNADEYEGPPRLVDVLPKDLRLNGVAVRAQDLATSLENLTATPQDTIILRPRDDASLQRVVEVMEALAAAGFSRLVLVE
ncbi:biopolymer transporter ExbD [Halovulum dunhuangense]|uniref:Biopolymer transporter ExbD n=1 Tax=Halovulum dunhuangense TaxID=1505036 RepID=A0A849L6T8_9RHOB|nr:biopolymer transporter ExbD [Halovulum dunhuangense]NNU82149.1 biopolymer transporter ExbD [Halovulum dunhuangense]